MNEMKISINYRDQDPEHIRLIWSQLNHIKNNIERRLNRKYSLEVDPINEKFYLVPIEETFSFKFPVTYSLDNKEFQSV